MIQLSEDLLIANGSDRRCYRHPDDEGLLLKVCIESRNGALKRTKREIFVYEWMGKRDIQSEAFATYFGKVMTSEGTGYVFELIRNRDGKISPTVENFLKNPPTDFDRQRDLPRLFYKFYEHCHSSACVLSDLHSRNIVVRCSDDPAQRSFCMIDGLGNADFIKICNWSLTFARIKLRRKFRKWAIRLGIEFKRK